MKYKVLATMMALLGFGASCSSIRQQKATEQPEEQPAIQQDTVEMPQIRLMYGVPPVVFRESAVKNSTEQSEQAQPEQSEQAQPEQSENPLKVIDNE